MQNEPNFRNSQMNLNPYNTTAYEKISDWTLGENEPKTNPIKANLETEDRRQNSEDRIQKTENR